MLAAVLSCLFGFGAGALLVVVAGLIHALRSPDRLLDAMYAIAFCGVGYLAGPG